MCIYICVYTYMCVYICRYIYIYVRVYIYIRANRVNQTTQIDILAKPLKFTSHLDRYSLKPIYHDDNLGRIWALARRTRTNQIITKSMPSRGLTMRTELGGRKNTHAGSPHILQNISITMGKITSSRPFVFWVDKKFLRFNG